MGMAAYSTGQVAQKLDIDKKTLLRWIYAGKLAEPKLVKTPASTIRVWAERDLKRAMQFKEQNYRKGRGRKKQP
jgi:predicted site-specific integrase-resolvase